MIRIIPRLDIKGPNLVKGIHFEGLRVLGKPEHFAQYYYQAGADELIYMDAVASLYERNSLLEIVERTSQEIFIPLCVGGGLRTLDDIRRVLRAGADKVSLNTAAIARPELIHEASQAFGSSTIVISIEAIKQPSGIYEAFVDYGRQATGVNAIDWAKRVEELGAGELVVTSIDREGTGRGFDLELTRRIATSVSIPVIAAGGAGNPAHVAEVVRKGMADAVCLASLLHYHVVKHPDAMRGDFSAECNLEFMRKGASTPRFIQDCSIADLKDRLAAAGVECRQEVMA